MADNITAGGFTTATDDIGGVHHQRVKVQFGAEDSATDVSTDAPLPVDLPAATVTALAPPAAITGFATEDKQDTGNAGIATLAGAVSGTEMQTDVVSITRPSVVRNGKTTVVTATTRVVLGSGALLSGVTLKALAANTGIIYVGNSTVAAANGFELEAGEQIYVDANDLDAVYVDASVGGEGVSYIGS